MKKLSLFLIAVSLVAACKKYNGTKDCSILPAAFDTLQINNAEVYAIAHGSKMNTYTILVEVANISTGSQFKINLLQLQKGKKCWEVEDLTEMRVPETIAYEAENVPKWTIDKETKVYVRLTDGTNEYYLYDNSLNQ